MITASRCERGSWSRRKMASEMRRALFSSRRGDHHIDWMARWRSIKDVESFSHRLLPVCVFCLPPSHFVSPEPEIEIGRRSQILFKELHFEKGARSLPLSHWFISFLSSRKRKEAGSLLELPVVQRRRRRVCVWRERTALPLVPGPTSASTDSYKREKRNFFPSSLFIFFLSSCPFVHLDSGVAARAQIWIGKDRVDRTGARPSAAGQFPALRSLLHSLYSRRWPSHAQFSSSFFFYLNSMAISPVSFGRWSLQSVNHLYLALISFLSLSTRLHI